MEIKRIEVPFEVKQVEEDDKFFHIYGLANTWEVDFGGDRSIKGCFQESISKLQSKAAPVMDGDGLMALIPALWQHRSDMPAGVQVELSETENGLESHSIYPKTDTFVSGRMIPQVKVGSIRKQSIGYIAEKVSYEVVDGRDIRNLEKVDLKEISLVTFPMNDGADITRVKEETQLIDVETVKKMTEREFEKILIKGNAKFSKDGSKAIIGRIKSGWDAPDDELREAEERACIEKMDKLIKIMEK